MSAYTSTQTGNWSSASTWGGSGPPGNGDSATIANGTTVTVDVNSTVGTSPANQTTFDLTINATGQLVIGNGVTLTMNGNINANAGSSGTPAHSIVWGPGSNLTFGSNTSNWVLQSGTYNTFYARGASGNLAVLTGPNTVSGRPYMTNSGGRGTGWDAQYMLFQYLGKSGTAAFRCLLDVSSSGPSTVSFVNCTFDNTFQLLLVEYGTTCNVTFQSCTFTNNLGNGLSITGKPGTTGTHLMASNLCDSTWSVNLITPAGYTVGGSTANANCFDGGFAAPTATYPPWPDPRATAISCNLIRNTSTGNTFGAASIAQNYFLMDTDSTGITTVSPLSIGGVATLDSNIIDWSSNAVDGNSQISPRSDGKVATISGLSNSSGLVEVTTSAAHGFGTGDTVCISGVTTTLNSYDSTVNNINRSNPSWVITVVDTTHFTLNGSTYTNAWSSGGYAYRLVTSMAITGGANNGSGLVRLTTAANLFSTNDVVTITGCTPSSINGTWTITPVSTTQFDLQGSTWSSFTTGGTVARPNLGSVVTHNITVMGSVGSNNGASVTVGSANSQGPSTIEHNTFIGGAHLNTTVGNWFATLTCGGNEGCVGQVASLRSNLFWQPLQSGSPAGMPNDTLAYPGAVMTRWQGVNIQDVVYAENTDYNWAYNSWTEDSLYGYVRSSGGTPAGNLTHMFSSGTPDAHGANGNATYRQDPQFVDTIRTLALYDTKVLGTSPSKGTWATSTAYNVGDTVSLATTAGANGPVYYGLTVNYRCISAHTSGATSKPAVGSSRRTYWEWNTRAQLRSNLSLINALWTWVRAGYAPKNPNIATAAADGTTCGAVPYLQQGNPILFSPFWNGCGSDFFGGING